MEDSITTVAAATSGSLTFEALKRHNDVAKSDVVMRVVFAKSDPGMSISSSVGQVSLDPVELPDWLNFDESWFVDVVHFNSDVVCASLGFSWCAGQDDVSMGSVLNELKKSCGTSIPDNTCVVLVATETLAKLKLDFSGCLSSARKFRHTCTNIPSGSNVNFKVKLNYVLVQVKDSFGEGSVD